MTRAEDTIEHRVKKKKNTTEMDCRSSLLLCGLFYLVNGQERREPDPEDILDKTPPRGYTCCHGYPDIHYYTFDKKMINYHGLCRHNVATPDNIDFRIEVVAYATITTGPSYPYYWNVIYNCTRVRVKYDLSTSVFSLVDAFFSYSVPASPAPNPLPVQGGLKVYKDPSNVIVMIPTGAYLWITDHAGSGFACVHDSYMKMMTGICGNFDGNAGNDERTSAARSVSPTALGHHTIGNSWQVYDPEDPCCENRPYPPRFGRLPHRRAKMICRKLQAEGSFSGCDRKVTEMYFKTCMDDVQAVNVDDDVIAPAVACKALENAALQCMQRNRKISNTWRRETDCGIEGVYGPWEEWRKCTKEEQCDMVRERMCLTGICREPLTEKRR